MQKVFKTLRNSCNVESTFQVSHDLRVHPFQHGYFSFDLTADTNFLFSLDYASAMKLAAFIHKTFIK